MNSECDIRISVMVQCSHSIMGLGCGYTGAAALVLGHYALLVAQIAQTIIVPATFQSLLDVCVYVSDPSLGLYDVDSEDVLEESLFLSILRYGSDVIDFSFLSYHLALAKVCESFISPIPPEFVTQQNPAQLILRIWVSFGFWVAKAVKPSAHSPPDARSPG